MKGSGSKTKASVAAALLEEPIELGSSDGEHLEPRSAATAELSGALATGPLCPNIYNKACKCKKDNPNCLAGIIPGPSGFRKKGLWQKDTKALLAQGHDPNDDLKEDGATPSGLKNLGNTCYVNGALQCLYMTPAFRQGLYAVELPVADDEIIQHIRQLFAAMQASAKASADPSAFASSLQLDNSVQQDGQEFFKLLLSHLEAKLQRSDSQDLRQLMPRLFRGSYAYETTCQVCRQLSEGSRRATHFYELDVQVKGYETLEKSLEEMQHAELLTGANQYFCSICNAKADAIRQLRLKSLPPYLCLSLQRFVFDMKKLMKVKASDKLSFPFTMDMRQVINTEGDGQDLAPGVPLTYDLAAILIHKGPSATHGHYVAHIREEGSNNWWRFDDEMVTAMPKGPMDSVGDLGVAAEKKPLHESRAAGNSKVPAGRQKRQKVGTPPAAVENAEPSRQESSVGASASACAEKQIVSSNAYMLLYRQQAVAGGLTTAEDIALPESLAAAVQAANDAFKAECEKFKEQKKALLQQIKDRQDRVRAILESAPLQKGQHNLRLVSANWLRRWADSIQPLPVDNSELLCSHGKLHPEKFKDAKKLRPEAWEDMRSGDGGDGPQLGPRDICQECVSQRRQVEQQQQASSKQRTAVLEQLQADELHPERCRNGFYVSKTWVAGWKKRAGQNVSTTSPTEGITCPHGSLMPESAGGKAKRMPVSRDVWGYLETCWQQACADETAKHRRKAQVDADAAAAKPLSEEPEKAEVIVMDEGWEPVPADLLDSTEAAKELPHANGHASPAPEPAADVEEVEAADAAQDEADERQLRTFPVASTADCQQCLRDLRAGEAAGRDLKEHVEQQKQMFPSLFSGVATYLEPGSQYCLLPRAWLTQWRSHLNSGLKREADRQPLLPLANALDHLLCECHKQTRAMLDHPPPKAVKKRGRWTAEESDVYELVPQGEALRLLDFHDADLEGSAVTPYCEGGPHPRMISASLELVQGDDGGVVPPVAKPCEGSSEEPAEANPTEQGAEDGSEQHAWWKVTPSELRRAAQLGRPGGEQGRLMTRPDVCRQAVEQREAQTLAVALNYTNAEIVVEVVSRESLQDAPSERKSKRARKGRGVLNVSSSNTLKELRMNIAQSLGVHPLNAVIHARKNGLWQAIEGEDLTLRELVILPEAELWVVNTEQHDDTDFASFVDSPAKGSQARERGFAGTVLTGQNA